MTEDGTVDILVIGAGPSGSTLARHLAAAGRDVLMLERARLPRPKACGGGIPARTVTALGTDIAPVIRARITSVALDGGFGARQIHAVAEDPAAPGAFVVDRAEFDHFLARQAQAAGAVLREDCALTAVTRTATGFEVDTTTGRVRCRVLCACDGANSATARALGFARNRLGFCLDGRVPMPADLPVDARTRAIFNPIRIRDGYAWAFPCGEQFTVGIGGHAPRRPAVRQELRRFVDATPELRGLVVSELRGGVLPHFAAPRARYADRGAYIVGDAAGLVDPLTGEGIYFAVVSARLAAQAILADDERRYDADLARTLIPELTIARHYDERYRAVPVWARRAGMNLAWVQRYARQFAGILLGQSTYAEVYRTMHKGREFAG